MRRVQIHTLSQGCNFPGSGLYDYHSWWLYCWSSFCTEKDSADRSPSVIRGGKHFMPGMFQCPCQHSLHIPIHPRLSVTHGQSAASAGKACLSSICQVRWDVSLWHSMALLVWRNGVSENCLLEVCRCWSNILVVRPSILCVLHIFKFSQVLSCLPVCTLASWAVLYVLGFACKVSLSLLPFLFLVTSTADCPRCTGLLCRVKPRQALRVPWAHGGQQQLVYLLLACVRVAVQHRWWQPHWQYSDQ